MADYEQNTGGDRKRRATSNVNADFEDLLIRWIQDANTRSISLTGALIQERARLFAEDLGMTEFKGSNGWLEKFLKRNNLACKTMCGERGDVRRETVEEWTSRLPNICNGYEPRDIFNMDETGIFFKSGGKTTYCDKDTQVSGGKRAKDRVTVALCASMTGEKLQPLVIGKSAKPRCFGKIKVENLPVIYRYNKKAWMNGRIFEEWLKNVDKKMRRQKRKILLFLDNASSHTELSLNNVKVVRLPANCTSVLQPMDQGIIQTLKLKFFKHQSTHILGQMEKTSVMGSDLLKNINVLDTIYWIDRAWRAVEISTICKCFDKCGFTPIRHSEQVQNSDSESDDDGDDEIPLAQLVRVERVYGQKITELVNMEVEVHDTEEIDWNKPASELLKEQECDAEESDSESVEIVESETVISLDKAQEYIELIKDMAREKGLVSLLKDISNASTTLSEERVKRQILQPKINDFFK